MEQAQTTAKYAPVITTSIKAISAKTPERRRNVLAPTTEMRLIQMTFSASLVMRHAVSVLGKKALSAKLAIRGGIMMGFRVA